MGKTTWKSVVAVTFLAFVATANRPDCDRRQPTLTCNDFTVRLSPDNCIDINNPCNLSGDWSRVDGFRLCDAPAGIFVRTSRGQSVTTRQICAAADVAFLDSVEVEYIYAEPREFGTGFVYIVILPGIVVDISASATTVQSGDQVDLTSTVTNGTPPYAYSWSSNPIGQIPSAQTTLANPTVNPTNHVIYTLDVTDDDGQKGSGSIAIDVPLEVAAIGANPDTIMMGGQSQLVAIPLGGDGSYSYRWQPATGLSRTDVFDPFASPAQTTTYSVTVNDGTGALATAEVTVYVEGTTPGLQACFTTSPPNPTTSTLIEFNATCSTGSIAEYRWWLFDPSDPDPTVTTPDPVSNFTPFDVPGTYDIKLEVVEQGTGNTASVIQQVTVVP